MSLYRTFIRHAVVQVLKADAAVAALVGDRVYPNREDPWMSRELPALGVYALSESPVESDVANSEEHKLELVIEAIIMADAGIDDTLDALEAAITPCIRLDAIGAAIVSAGGRDTLLSCSWSGTTVELADDGKLLLGVATMTWGLEYRIEHTEPAPDITDFALLDTTMQTVADSEAELDSEDQTTLPGPFPDLKPTR